MLLTPVHVLIADRNAMSSELLAESLGRHSRFEVVPLFPATTILSAPIQRDPTVAIISADLDSGPQKGVYLARALRARHPQLAIVILLESLEREHVIASFRAGAKAVFCRDRSASELHKCIESVAQGRLWIGSVEAEYVLDAIQSAPSCDGMGDIKKLSAREGLVAELAAQGLSNKQIAHRLSLSEHTVKNYIFRIFDKLNVSNRIELSFLMMKRRDSDYELAARILSDANPTNPSVVAAAENGVLTAQFIAGMAYVKGQAVEQNDRAAYYWLRRAELNCFQVLQQSRSALDEISARLVPEERQTLEQKIGECARENDGRGPKPTMNKAPESVACMTRVAS